MPQKNEILKALERKEHFAWSNSSVCKLIFPDFMEISVRILLPSCHPLHRGAFWQNIVRYPNWVLVSSAAKCKWFPPSVKYWLYFCCGLLSKNWLPTVRNLVRKILLGKFLPISLVGRTKILWKKSHWKNLVRNISLEKYCWKSLIRKSHWKKSG